MSLLVNGAGVSAADPILKGLGYEWVVRPTSLDVATMVGMWIDANATIPGSNNASPSPSLATIISGAAGAYDDSTKKLTLLSVAGLSVGDYIEISHGSITQQVVKILSIAGNDVTMSPNPFNGLGNKTGVSYQVAWRSLLTAGTSPSVSSGAGTQNFHKARLQDSAGNSGDLSESNYVRDPLVGAAYISIGGKAYTGLNVVNTLTPSLDILNGWANRGGIATVQLANHSTQSVNNFQFGDSTTAEKTIAAALAAGLKLSAPDGNKYGQMIFRAMAGSAVTVAVDIDMRLDTTAPGVGFMAYGR